MEHLLSWRTELVSPALQTDSAQLFHNSVQHNNGTVSLDYIIFVKANTFYI